MMRQIALCHVDMVYHSVAPGAISCFRATAKTLLRQCCDTDLPQAQQLEIKSEYFG
jgi:hypothetical protein